MRRSPSVYSYGMLKPSGPNLRRSRMTPWKRHRDCSRCLNSFAWNTTQRWVSHMSHIQWSLWDHLGSHSMVSMGPSGVTFNGLYGTMWGHIQWSLWDHVVHIHEGPYESHSRGLYGTIWGHIQWSLQDHVVHIHECPYESHLWVSRGPYESHSWVPRRTHDSHSRDQYEDYVVHIHGSM